LVELEEFFRRVWQLTQCEGWVDVHLLAERAHHLLSVVPIREHTRSRNETMHGVADCSDQYPAARENNSQLASLLAITRHLSHRAQPVM
jgi:hypothetical protein